MPLSVHGNLFHPTFRRMPTVESTASHLHPPDVAHEAIDGSEAILTMYLEISLREDMETVEVWNQDAKSILLFSGLFSATVAAALGPTLPDLTVGSQDVSSAYLEHIYEFLVGLNGSQPDPTISSELDLSTVPFQLVNSLWFLSLILSLTCALLAVSLQQWTRRYLVAVRRRGTPYGQARTREFLAEGIRDSGIAILVDVMRTGHQLSFVLFAIGLLVYFANTDPLTYAIMVSWLALWAVLYLWMTIAGILRKNSPYHSPLLSFIQLFPRLMLSLCLQVLESITGSSTSAPNGLEKILKKLIPRGAGEEVEESAQKISKNLDSRTLEWTFESLNQAHEFERFFAGIPDFCSPRAVKDPKAELRKLNSEQKLSQALIGLVHQTVTSHLVSGPARQQRIDICTKAIETVPAVANFSTLRRVFDEWDGFLGSIDAAVAILHACDNNDPAAVCCARCIVAIALARTRVHDTRWRDLTTKFLTSDTELWDGRIAATTLPDYLVHDGSALLANLIFITRAIIRFHPSDPTHSRDRILYVSSKTLDELLSNINVQLAQLPETRDEYCALWAELDLERRCSDAPTIAADIFERLDKTHITLHDSTGASLAPHPSTDVNDPPPVNSYSLCKHRRTQAKHPTTGNPTNPASRLVPDPLGSVRLAGTTEDAHDAPNSSSADAGPSRPTARGLPPATHPSVENLPTLQENHGQTEMPPFVVIDSPLLSSSDVTNPVAQSVRTSPKLGSPSRTPDAETSSTAPDTSP